MFKKPILTAVILLALTTLACAGNFEFPVTEIETGPTQTTDISVPLLDDPETIAEITLAFGAGNLNIAPGAEEALITGVATYNVADFAPVVTTDENAIRLEQGNLTVNGIPNFESNLENEWDLQLGSTPINLTINAGAYVGDYELGGLALNKLTISDGAADIKVNFSEPNLTEMESLNYNTGASNVTMTGIANANTPELIFRCGAGSYTLDFSGELQQDMQVSIESGISSIAVIVPEGVSAEVTYEGGMSNVSLDGSWEKSGSTYTHAGEGYTITITIKMGAGNLELRDK